MSTEIPSDPHSGTPPLNDVDATPLLGAWTNTNAASTQIAAGCIQVAARRPMLSVWGVALPRAVDWGEVPIRRLYRGSPATPQAAAFEAQFEFGSMTALLEANLSKGLLIIACLKTFHDGSGRSSYFVREFFRKTAESKPPELAAVPRAGRCVTCAGDEPTPGLDRSRAPRLDPVLFVGRWENTDSATRGLREVRMSDRDGGLRLEIGFADGPAGGGQWETVGELFGESPAGTVASQFHAVLERSGQTLRMHGWVKLGVLVIAVFRNPTGSPDSPPWFDREFFYQSGRP